MARSRPSTWARARARGPASAAAAVASKAMRSVSGGWPSTSGSSCSSGVPGPTWLLASASTCRTRPAKGERTAVSIFIDSSTARVSPAATRSPARTATPTTTAGEGARTMPRSSREKRCACPSTSTRCWSPSTVESTRWRAPPMVSQRSWADTGSTRRSTRAPSTRARYQPGPSWKTWTR